MRSKAVSLGPVGPQCTLEARLPAGARDVHALALRLGAACPALLETGGPSTPGAVHVLPLAPRALLVSEKGRCRWLTPDGAMLHEVEGGALEEIRRVTTHLRLASAAREPGPAGLAGGMVVLLGFDVVHEIERLPRVAPPRDAWPDALAWLVGAALVVPADGGPPRLVALEDAGALGHQLRVGLDASEREALVGVVEDAWNSGAGSPGPTGRPLGPAVALTTAADHAAMVGVIREHLLAGDLYQANIGLRFEAPWEGSGLILHEILRRHDPAPFSGWLRWPGGEFVSNSPERLVSLIGRALRTEPIAGTAPLLDGAPESAVEDEARRLGASAKNAAEHVMIVDIHRNDLGRVSAPGTVRTESVFRIERRRHVLQAVADVRGVLAEGCDAVDVVRAILPGGCVSGVPKVRCLEIIDQVEPWRRGPWTGAFGWVAAGGDLDLAVVIRSAWRIGGTLGFAAGGGIVLDSRANDEHAELQAKARAITFAVDELRACPAPMAAPAKNW